MVFKFNTNFNYSICRLKKELHQIYPSKLMVVAMDISDIHKKKCKCVQEKNVHNNLAIINLLGY